jgi:hypothetical protein
MTTQEKATAAFTTSKRVTIKKKHMESICFIISEYINTHDYTGNVHFEDLEAAKELLYKLES